MVESSIVAYAVAAFEKLTVDSAEILGDNLANNFPSINHDKSRQLSVSPTHGRCCFHSLPDSVPSDYVRGTRRVQL